MKHLYNYICYFILIVSIFIPMNPIYLTTRNIFTSSIPQNISRVYNCSSKILSDITVVVSIKDTCSQTPAFLKQLEKITTPETEIIYTFPSYISCRHMHKDRLTYWNKVRTIPIHMKHSPMMGWRKASKYIKTQYSYLVHNDGYALDENILCELFGALNTRKKEYIIAAPMLYENYEGGFGAHATQSNLQVTKSDNKFGKLVFHTHSYIRALDRGFDMKETDQTEFLEDHGFLIRSEYITKVIDPYASFTLEYLDMILNIRRINKKVIFVPSARLEFRVTEFLLQDIPYFAYKRSEEIAHRTRDYISTKWQVGVPNTGFWTYIKYTILENHVYCHDSFVKMSWYDHVMVMFGFFQLSGYNRYKWSSPRLITLPEVVNIIDNRKVLPAKVYEVSRITSRPNIKVKHMNNISDIVNTGYDNPIGLKHEYAPVLTYKSIFKCINIASIKHICNVVITSTEDICICWGHIPIFRQLSTFSLIAKFLISFIKIPSRVVTYLEMLLYNNINVSDVMSKYNLPMYITSKYSNLTLFPCESDSPSCKLYFEFTKNMRIEYFSGNAIYLYDFLIYISSLNGIHKTT